LHLVTSKSKSGVGFTPSCLNLAHTAVSALVNQIHCLIGRGIIARLLRNVEHLIKIQHWRGLAADLLPEFDEENYQASAGNCLARTSRCSPGP